MSYIVDCKGETVWQPARRVGDYFLGNIEILEKLIESSSGITSPLADGMEINAAVLSDFIEKTLNFIEKTNNTPLVVMMSGIVELIIALNAEINGVYPEVTSKNRTFIENSKKVFYPIEDYLS